MRFYRRSLILLVATVLICACATQLDDIESRRTEVENEMLQGKRLHDGALELADIGDIDSVPALLVVLKENPPRNGSVICTAAHALAALRKVSGTNAGSTHEEWTRWWEEHKRQTGTSP